MGGGGVDGVFFQIIVQCGCEDEVFVFDGLSTELMFKADMS